MSEQFVVRAAELVGAYGNYGTRPDLVDAETIALARCTMINQELDLFVRFIYRGKSNLTRTERDTLRRYLFSLGHSNRPPRPLFFYATRHWHVNTVIYPTQDDALQWLARYQMTPALWLEFVVR